MSVSTEIDRLQLAADGIRGKMMELGAAESGDNLTTLSQKITVLEKPNGNKGQIVGFVENNEIGAMDAPSGSGGGAIPAYIVGDTMLPGWLSETENGEALTPVDMQEYVIMTSGEWLRKHVMWVEEIGVYRLTGKVEVADEVQREILKGVSTQNITGGGGQNAETYTADKITVSNGSTIRFKLTWGVQVNSTVDVMVGNNVLDTIVCTQPSDDVQTGSYDKTFKMTSEYNGLHPAIRRNGKGGSWGIARASNIEITYTDNYLDYETDDVIDITESEIETIWGETAGAADPTNNVFSTEERLWGYWIDGKPIYRKTVNCGALPSGGRKTISHGISNIDKVIEVKGYSSRSATDIFQIPFAMTDNNVMAYGNAQTIDIITDADLAVYTETYVTLYYTKTA